MDEAYARQWMTIQSLSTYREILAPFVSVKINNRLAAHASEGGLEERDILPLQQPSLISPNVIMRDYQLHGV